MGSRDIQVKDRVCVLNIGFFSGVWVCGLYVEAISFCFRFRFSFFLSKYRCFFVVFFLSYLFFRFFAINYLVKDAYRLVRCPT